MKDTVVHWGQFNRMKRSIGTKDAVGKLETFIPLVQSQLGFSFQQIKKEASRACNALGPMCSGLLMLHQIVWNDKNMMLRLRLSMQKIGSCGLLLAH